MLAMPFKLYDFSTKRGTKTFQTSRTGSIIRVDTADGDVFTLYLLIGLGHETARLRARCRYCH